MADDKKSKSKKSVKHPSKVAKEWAEEEGLSPPIVINKKTGKPDREATFNLTSKGVLSKWASEESSEYRAHVRATLRRLGIETTEDELLLDRIAKAETKSKRKKVTGPELTTPKSKKRKGAKGMFVGPSYRHGHKDLRKSGTSTRIK